MTPDQAATHWLAELAWVEQQSFLNPLATIKEIETGVKNDLSNIFSKTSNVLQPPPEEMHYILFKRYIHEGNYKKLHGLLKLGGIKADYIPATEKPELLNFSSQLDKKSPLNLTATALTNAAHNRGEREKYYKTFKILLLHAEHNIRPAYEQGGQLRDFEDDTLQCLYMLYCAEHYLRTSVNSFKASSPGPMRVIDAYNYDPETTTKYVDQVKKNKMGFNLEEPLTANAIKLLQDSLAHVQFPVCNIV